MRVEKVLYLWTVTLCDMAPKQIHCTAQIEIYKKNIFYLLFSVKISKPNICKDNYIMENSIEDTVTELVLARVPPETKIVIMAVMGSRGSISNIYFWTIS